MLVLGSRPLRRQGPAPSRNPYPAQTHVPSREWFAVLPYLRSRTTLPVRQTQHSRLPPFLSPRLALRNLQPAVRTLELSPAVRNKRLCRPPILLATPPLRLSPHHCLPAPPFQKRRPARTQFHPEPGH